MWVRQGAWLMADQEVQGPRSGLSVQRATQLSPQVLPTVRGIDMTQIDEETHDPVSFPGGMFGTT